MSKSEEYLCQQVHQKLQLNECETKQEITPQEITEKKLEEISHNVCQPIRRKARLQRKTTIISAEESKYSFTKEPVFEKSTTFLLEEGVITLPFINKRMRELAGVSGIRLKYKDFYFNGMCLIDCKSSPHPPRELDYMKEVIDVTEFKFSCKNLEKDESFRKLMDEEGWISCKIIYDSPEIQEIGVSFEVFMLSLEHTLNCRVSDDKEYVRTVFAPEIWPKYNEVKNQDWRFPEKKIADLRPCMELGRFFCIIGCHQRMAREFNNRIKMMMQNKINDFYKYYIVYNLITNEFDDSNTVYNNQLNFSRTRNVKKAQDKKTSFWKRLRIR